jgi:hypothetical protein
MSHHLCCDLARGTTCRIVNGLYFRSQQISANDGMGESMAGAELCNPAESQDWAGKEMARLVVLQFGIDQMALAVFVQCRS